ncbi:hypothetical protein WJX73_009466 [Symbiochloris irregularis]|uniref:Uncharacterized protein n=1 Tax=Symbiochloris irregularis TaxID=706552 RepID=A0AAW1PIT3_9CHLO
MPFHFREFLPPDEQADHPSLHGLAHFPDHLIGALLAGPKQCCKTTMLFHFAWHQARQGRKVLFFCNRNKMEELAATLTYAKRDAALERVQMRYLETSQELQTYASCMHLSESRPDCIIADDISSFLSGRMDRRAWDAELVKTLAFLHDAQMFAHTDATSSDQQRCLLLISDTVSQDNPHSIFIFRRWLPLLLDITAGQNGFVLRTNAAVAERHSLPASCSSRMHYSLTAHCGLSLNNIEGAA